VDGHETPADRDARRQKAEDEDSKEKSGRRKKHTNRRHTRTDTNQDTKEGGKHAREKQTRKPTTIKFFTSAKKKPGSPSITRAYLSMITGLLDNRNKKKHRKNTK